PQQPGGPGGPGGPAQGRPARPAPNWRKRIKWTAIVVVAALVVTTVSTYFWADGKIRREVDLSKVIDRPAEGKGTNYLIVGSDSREGMSKEDKKRLHTGSAEGKRTDYLIVGSDSREGMSKEDKKRLHTGSAEGKRTDYLIVGSDSREGMSKEDKKRLHTGSAEGKRTDSMMILHTGDNGTTMISLPRDSNITIPSFKGSDSGKMYPARGANKLNAAYAFDGPELPVRTIEYNTGLHIDHYAEIGFDGFASIVDAVGGVEMDIPKGFKDEKSGADFKAGKQTLNGEQALAFVRTRYALPGSDLDRTKNQQKFLAALAHQVATPSTIINPFKLSPVMGSGLDSLIVDKDMSLWNLVSMFWAMKGVTGGDGKQMNMPIAGSVGGNLAWDMPKVKQLVNELKNDDKVTVSGN
ncbi:LCP family protein, partial [Streptomyces sp. NEAU-H3]|uniref:LCP family protein n=1 Tax=Streptomyces sp. NEAU-H3 TaxID=2720636 RepID=UPI001FD80984